MSITAGSDAVASDFVSASSGASDSGKVAKLDSVGKIPFDFAYQPEWSGLNAAESISAGAPIAVGPYQSDGGVLLDTSAANFTTASAGAKTIAFTVASNSNREMIVFIETAKSTGISATYNGVSLVQSGSQLSHESGAYYTWTFALAAPATGTNNLVISGLNATEIFGYAIYSYYNVDQSTPIAQNVTNTATGAGGISATVTPTYVASVLLAFAGFDGNSNTFTLTNMSNASGSNNINTTGSTNQMVVGDSLKLTTTADVTVTATANAGSHNIGIVVVELKPAATATYRAWNASAANGSTYFFNSNWKCNSFIGFARAAATAGNAVYITVAGVASGLSALVPPLPYYLADSAGTIATTAGTNSRKVGIAGDTTHLVITNIW